MFHFVSDLAKLFFLCHRRKTKCARKKSAHISSAIENGALSEANGLYFDTKSIHLFSSAAQYFFAKSLIEKMSAKKRN